MSGPRPESALRSRPAGGPPLTARRQAVLEALAARSDHPCVDQIYQDVARRMPEVSLATVYRALDALAGMDLLRRVGHPDNRVRYDANLEPHHHFLCTRCGSLGDLPLEGVAGYRQLEVVDAAPAVVHEVEICVRGLCGDCATGSRTRS